MASAAWPLSFWAELHQVYVSLKGRPVPISTPGCGGLCTDSKRSSMVKKLTHIYCTGCKKIDDFLSEEVSN